VRCLSHSLEFPFYRFPLEYKKGEHSEHGSEGQPLLRSGE